MKSLNKHKDQSACAPVSSNCVIWQGPDIPCIDLCKGDSITDVTYKLAMELCEVLRIVDVSIYDLDCFDEFCPKLETFDQLIQFILDKLCELQTCCTTNTDDINLQKRTVAVNTIAIAKCFQYINSLGVNVTALELNDYVTAIGNKVCEINSLLTSLQTVVASNVSRIELLEIAVSSLPTPPNYIITTSCLFPFLADIPIVTFVTNTEQALCNLLSVTGTPTDITLALGNICVGLDDELSLGTDPTLTMRNLPNWVSQANYSTIADTITNMWITICDLREAVKNLQLCCAPSCSDVTVDFISLIMPTATTMSLTTAISVPAGFTACDTNITITDACGNVKNIVKAGSSLTSFTAGDLGTPLVANSLCYNVQAVYCFTGPDGISCNKVIQNVVKNIITVLCPKVILSAGAAAGETDYTFTAPISTCPYKYILSVYRAGTNELLAFEEINTFGGAESGSFFVSVPRPVSIETQLMVTQGSFTHLCNRDATPYIIPL